MAIVFCRIVPENAKRKPTPITMPGKVLVIMANPSMAERQTRGSLERA